ncbi:SUSD6 protein, partial [Drymodes brunneopygia]|nr:SUSD6 protein [Drymodes brunneopygia]
MCHGMVASKSSTGSSLALTGHGLFRLLVIFGSFILEAQSTDCPQPPQPENGGYKCHPSPCNNPLTSGSVIEYLCVEGYMLKGDYKYLTCKNGEWNPAMEVSCRLSPEKDSPPTIGVPTLSIVASTASSVALILLLVVLFVLLQPKLKSFHHSR